MSHTAPWLGRLWQILHHQCPKITLHTDQRPRRCWFEERTSMRCEACAPPAMSEPKWDQATPNSPLPVSSVAGGYAHAIK
jgi:hypothetical protein